MLEDKDGWHHVDASDMWKCPECNEWSSYVDWDETTVACDDCGEHDARRCPKCDEVFDLVWGSKRIAEATFGV